MCFLYSFSITMNRAKLHTLYMNRSVRSILVIIYTTTHPTAIAAKTHTKNKSISRVIMLLFRVVFSLFSSSVLAFRPCEV